MGEHPEWLRFHAYAVGLPRTGTTSLAGMLGRYRTVHEVGLDRLSTLAVERVTGALDDEGFWREAGGRLHPVRLEMDAVTCHHLYADLLARRFPHARFVVTYRDVRGWANSLLDLMTLFRRSPRPTDLPPRAWYTSYAPWATEGLVRIDAECVADDSALVLPLMRTWAAHVRLMAEVLPAERTLWVRTRDLSARADEVADFLGVPGDSLDLAAAHANRTVETLDRFTLADRAAVDAEYARVCAGPMADHFPEEHARFAARDAVPVEPAWGDYVARVDQVIASRPALEVSRA